MKKMSYHTNTNQEPENKLGCCNIVDILFGPHGGSKVTETTPLYRNKNNGSLGSKVEKPLTSGLEKEIGRNDNPLRGANVLNGKLMNAGNPVQNLSIII